MPGPRAGSTQPSRHERYIVSTVGVPPTNTKRGQGVAMGLMEPASANTAFGVGLQVSGELRQNAASDPSITVQATDLNIAPSGQKLAVTQQGLANLVQSASSLNAFALLFAVAVFAKSGNQFQNPTATRMNAFANVARFGVRRSDYDRIPVDDAALRGVTRNFVQWPNDSLFQIASHPRVASEGETGWNVTGVPRFIEKDGIAYIWHLATLSENTDLVVSKFDPSLDTRFVHLGTYSESTGQYLNQAVEDDDIAPQWLGVAPVVHAGAIYCVLAAKEAGSGRRGLLFTVRLNADNTQELILNRGAPLFDIATTDTPNPVTDFGGIDAVSLGGFCRIAVGLNCPGVCSLPTSRTVVYVDTPDFRNFSGEGRDTGEAVNVGAPVAQVSLGGMELTGEQLPGTILRMHRRGANVWGVGTNGLIAKSTNHGRTWLQLDSPVTSNRFTLAVAQTLHDIQMTNDDVGYACGDKVVLRTTDGGASWQVVWRGITDGGWITPPTAPFSFDSGGGDWRGVAVKDNLTAWVCGQGGSIIYTADGGTTWSTIWQPVTNGTYNSIVLADPSTNRIFAAGSSNVHAAHNIPQDQQTKRIIEIVNANAAKAVGSTDVIYHAAPASQAAQSDFVKLIRQSSTSIYGLTSSGEVWRWGGANWSLSFQVLGSFSDMASISTTEIMLVGNQVLWRVRNPQTSVNRTIVATALPSSSSTAAAVSFSETVGEEDIGVVSLANGRFAFANAPVAMRSNPRMAIDSGGSLVMTTMNLDRGEREVWRFDASNRVPTLVDKVGQFTAEADPSVIPDTIPRHCLAVDVNGDLLMPIGANDGDAVTDVSYVSQNRGSGWVVGSSPFLGLPLGGLAPVSTTYTAAKIRTTRDVLAFSRGRLFSSVVRSNSKNIGIFASRDFAAATDSNPTDFVPILPGKWQWSGVDGVLVRFNGMPNPGDTFATEPVFDFGSQNLAEESPSIAWRSPISATDTVGEQLLVWDRTASKITEILGDGGEWDVSAMALFRSNFRTVYFGTSTNGSSYTEVLSDSTVHTGTADKAANAGIIGNTTANLVHSQFKPVNTKYFLQVTSGANSGKVFDVLDNGKDYIKIRNATALGTGFTYAVFSNKHILTLASVAHARFIRIRIPAQQAVGRYFLIGTPIIGTYADYNPYEGCEDRRRFSSGFGWQPIPNVAAQLGESGVDSVENLGLRQRWTLPYESAKWWDRDMQINGLLSNLSQAFAIQFDGGDTQSLELVRLSSGSQNVNTFGDQYSFTHELVEVV